MTPSIVRGKATVLGIIAGILLLELLAFALTGPERLVSTLVRIGLALVLPYFLYRGATWARVILVILLGLGGLGWLVAANPSIVFGGLGVIYLGMGGLLLWSKDVLAFLNNQREFSA